MASTTEKTEHHRRRELQRHQVRGALGGETLDGLCTLICKITGAEAAFIAFLDEDTIVLPAKVGVVATELVRAGSLLERLALGGQPSLLYADGADTGDLAGLGDLLPGASVHSLIAMPIEVRKGLAIGVTVVLSTEVEGLSKDHLTTLQLLRPAIVDHLKLCRAKMERQQDHARKLRKNAEIAAQKSEIDKQRRLLEQTSRLARIGGWEYDIESDRLQWSAEVYRILEVEPKAFKPSFANVERFFREDALPQITALFKQALTTGEPFEIELPVITAQSRPLRIRYVCEPEVRRGKVVRMIGTLQDVTLQRATEEEVNFIATHDMVTGLINRGVFQERLDRALSRPGGKDFEGVGLFLVDVDHFKSVNDTLGHHAGDVLLAEVGRRLQAAAARKRGLVGRLGGDEFALLVTEAANEEELLALGGDMMRELIAPIAYGAESIPVTISVGIAMGSSGATSDQLLKDADIALYEAKGAGRNRFVMFDRSMRDELELRHSILRAIRTAIELGQLVLYYQPKVSLRTGSLTGFEALLRWRRPDGFVATPAFFGSALDDPQLGQAIGDMVIEEAVAQAARWDRMGFDYDHIAINVSTSQFRRGDLDTLVFATLAKHKVRPQALMIEVTENVLLSKEADNVQSTLVRMANDGVKIALDDFGTGYASLTHLKEFPVDLLKIDRSFVSNLTDQRESRAIVRGITSLAHDLGVAVIAEGIETPAQRDMLRHFGADFGQGYLFARPMPSEQVEALYFSDLPDVTISA